MQKGQSCEIQSKFLITKIQVNLCCLLQASGIGTQFTCIVVIKIFAIILPSRSPLGATLDFTTFFMLSFFAWATYVCSLAVDFTSLCILKLNCL